MPVKNAIPKILIPVDGITFQEQGDEVISDIQVCMTGTWTHDWYGEFEITKKHHRQMRDNQKKSKRKLTVDYNHSSLSPDPDAAISAGWMVEGTEMKTKKNETQLWATISWTPKAVERIKAREYRFISPEIDFDYTDKESGEKIGAVLLAIALTNRPFLEGMEEVTLTDPVVAASVRFTEKPSPPTKGATGMNEKRIREILGLSEDVEITEDHRNQAMQKLDEQLADAQKKIQATEPPASNTPPEDDDEEDEMTITKAQFAEMQANIKLGADAAKALNEMKVDALLSEGIRAGKVLPAEKEELKKLAMKDFGSIKKLIDARPKLVDFSEIGGSSAPEAGAGSDEEKALADFQKNRKFYEGLGLTEEDAKKYRHVFAN